MALRQSLVLFHLPTRAPGLYVPVPFPRGPVCLGILFQALLLLFLELPGPLLLIHFLLMNRAAICEGASSEGSDYQDDEKTFHGRMHQLQRKQILRLHVGKAHV